MKPTIVDNWTGLKPHPAASIFPPMSTEEREELMDDIRTNGYDPSLPIVLCAGEVLDGLNRLDACQRLRQRGEYAGPPPCVEWEGTGEPLAWVVRVNLKRRNLSAGQRALIAAELEPVYQAAAKERQRAGGGDHKSKKQAGSVTPRLEGPKGEAAAQAAAVLGVSRAYVAAAKALSPELKENVRSGALTLPKATKTAKENKHQKKPILAVVVGAAPDAPGIGDGPANIRKSRTVLANGIPVPRMFVNPGERERSKDLPLNWAVNLAYTAKDLAQYYSQEEFEELVLETRAIYRETGPNPLKRDNPQEETNG